MSRRSWTTMALAAVMTFVAAPAAFGGQLFGVHYNTGDLYSVSTVDASLTLIGSTGLHLAGLDLHTDGFLYGITPGSSATLYQVDPSNANATPVGALGIGFVFEGALVIAPDGTGYGAHGDSAGNPQLFEVDLGTGAATVIGTISSPPHDIAGLAWRSDGMLVGLDSSTNALLEIDPTNANSSVIGGVSPQVGNAGGMAVLDGTGYFATGGPVVGGSNELYSFDLFTGQHTLVGGFGAPITGVGMSGLAAAEPSFDLGALNCDGGVNAFDIDPFVLALTDPAGYAAAFPDCDIMLADCNGDGVVNAFDIDPFVALLVGP